MILWLFLLDATLGTALDAIDVYSRQAGRERLAKFAIVIRDSDYKHSYRDDSRCRWSIYLPTFILTYSAFLTGSPVSMPLLPWQLETWEGRLCLSLREEPYEATR